MLVLPFCAEVQTDDRPLNIGLCKYLVGQVVAGGGWWWDKPGDTVTGHDMTAISHDPVSSSHTGVTLSTTGQPRVGNIPSILI